jgi:aspartyl-tRNA(Asn)/glutamyl-tRNA(Gln) amidotransferase subunit A
MQYKMLLKDKKISPKEIYQEQQKVLIEQNPKLNSAIEIFSLSQKELENLNREGSLFAIPYGLKDIIFEEGREITAASKVLTGHIAPYSATVVKKLSEAGSYALCRANCDEFAMGSSNETSYYGPTKNPWDIERIPGGSSGGSAAMVASGALPFALGTETGGSVRQPSALCGLTGLKTTYGLHSRFGVIAYASSLDQIGIFTKDVVDAALVLSETAGHDPFDSTTTKKIIRHDYLSPLKKSVKGKKIAIITNAIESHGITPETQKNLYDAIALFKKISVEVEEIALPIMEYSAAVYFIVSRSEAASNFARIDGIRYGHRALNSKTLDELYTDTRSEGFGEIVKRRILVGNQALAKELTEGYYNKAKKLQDQIQAAFKSAFTQYDALFSPVVPTVAPKIGEIATTSLQLDLQDYFTASVNLAGLPALALPSGFINGLPMGFQLIGNHFSEEILLQLGFAYQKATDWHTHYPDI